MTEEGRLNLRKSWTPERRAAQAERMRNRMRKARGKPLGKPRKGKKATPGRRVATPPQKTARRGSPKALGAQMQATLYLGQACDLLQAGYRHGVSVGDADPLVFLAFRALTKRTPK